MLPNTTPAAYDDDRFLTANSLVRTSLAAALSAVRRPFLLYRTPQFDGTICLPYLDRAHLI